MTKIDITKQSICDSCGQTSSKKKPVDNWTISIGTKRIKLCKKCLEDLKIKIENVLITESEGKDAGI